jgi:hypothetical protein
MPGTLHLEVAVYGQLTDPMQDVLANADDTLDGFAGEIDGSECRYPKVGDIEDLSGQHLVQGARGPIDGVAFGH